MPDYQGAAHEEMLSQKAREQGGKRGYGSAGLVIKVRRSRMSALCNIDKNVLLKPSCLRLPFAGMCVDDVNPVFPSGLETQHEDARYIHARNNLKSRFAGVYFSWGSRSRISLPGQSILTSKWL
jgi:hypothetical protein